MLKSGMKVRFTATLGVMASSDAPEFSGKVEPGDEGELIGKHPDKRMKGWWLVKVEGGVVPIIPIHVVEATEAKKEATPNT